MKRKAFSQPGNRPLPTTEPILSFPARQVRLFQNQPQEISTNDLVIAVTHRHGRDLREFGPTFLTWPANYGGQGLSPGSAAHNWCGDCLGR
jgi:hypothetical protein